MTQGSLHRQSGVTVIGFLLLAAVFGTVGLATLKIVPLYMEQMKIKTVLNDVQKDLSGSGSTAASIRNALNARFYVDYMELETEEIEIKPIGGGFSARVLRESDATFFGDLSFVLHIDEQVEITR
jgi:hypothetical protein